MKNVGEINFTPDRMTVIKTRKTGVGKAVEKLEPCALVVWTYNGASTLEKSTTNAQKLTIELPYDPAIPLLSIYSEELKEGSLPMFITASFTAAQRTKSKNALMDE